MMADVDAASCPDQTPQVRRFPKNEKTNQKGRQYEATVPTIADRVAQTVVASYLEERAEPRFHPDSYGYRPKKSALHAVEVCRARCWRYDWAVDLDVQKFFDTVPWDLVVKAVEVVTGTPWVLLYVKRWLAAPLQYPDGTLVERDKGTPQGSAASPILANLYLLTELPDRSQ
jgi:RNA-directed DNA polymerase